MKYKPQLYQETCYDCKPFAKYGTTRLVKKDESVCSVCGKVIRGEAWLPDDTRDKRLLCFNCAPDDAIRLKDTI